MSLLLLFAGGAAIITGTGAVADAGESVASSAFVRGQGAGSVTDGGEAISAQAAVRLSGLGGVTEGADTAAGTGGARLSGTGGATEAGETTGAAASARIGGLGGISEAGEGVSGAAEGEEAISGAGFVFEDVESLSSPAAVVVQASALAPEPGEQVSGLLMVPDGVEEMTREAQPPTATIVRASAPPVAQMAVEAEPL